jgi:hypothetical protein
MLILLRPDKVILNARNMKDKKTETWLLHKHCKRDRSHQNQSWQEYQ